MVWTKWPWGVSAWLVVASGCAGTQVPELPEKIVGRCEYTNRFSKLAECRDYHGEWADEAVEDDCRGWEGTTGLGHVCGTGEVYGHCILDSGDGRFIRVSLPGNEPENCGSTQRGCELFGGGRFIPSSVCGGRTVESSGTGLPIFQQPSRVCVDPKPGEPPGQSEGGQVCTWEMISGATEEGRNFQDYASCDKVRTQRPYYPVRPADDFDRSDERLQDPAYAAEVAWVRGQLQSAACVCCHSTSAPEGPSNWYVDAPGNFINSFFPRGLAMGAGWINTVGFGAYPKEQNNGFSRATPDNPHHSAFPTTDDARIRRFFENELAYRGFTKATFANQPYGAGPLDDQRLFRPSACANGEGVNTDGSIQWSGGKARYLYILEAQSDSPTVPPNLDLPIGTRWRVDVPLDGVPMSSGSVRYGEVPNGARQKFPETGGPGALVSGQPYYLYVTADVGFPITRCLFTAR